MWVNSAAFLILMYQSYCVYAAWLIHFISVSLIQTNELRDRNAMSIAVLTLTLTVPGGHIQPDTHPWLTHSRSRFWQVLAHSIPASLALSHSNCCSGGGQEIERRPTGEAHTQRIHYMDLSESLFCPLVCLWCVQVQLCSIRSEQRYDREEEYLLKMNVDQRRGQTE